MKKDVICPTCGLNTGHTKGAKGAMATHIRFRHNLKGKWKRDAMFDSKQKHEHGRKKPGKVYKKRR